MFQRIIPVFVIMNQHSPSPPRLEDSPFSKFPKPPKDPCTEADKMCDFKPDCQNKEDEAKCGASAHLFPFIYILRVCRGFFKTDLLHLPAGDFSYPEGSSGWTDTSIGSQGWDLYKNSTSKGTNAFSQYYFVSLPPHD